MDWKTLSDAEIEEHYNPRIAVPDYLSHFAKVQDMSAAARAHLTSRLDLRYGDGPLETFDLFPATSPNAPIHIFIHGGYWRALDKSDYSFMAESLVAAGAMVITLNYDLCPAVTLDKLVDEVRRGIAYVARNAEDLGGDADRIFLSGHSAGAHLSAMAIAHDWTTDGLPADLIKGVVLATGIYDPAPVLRVSTNAEIGLTAEMAERNNACTKPPLGGCEVLVAIGSEETKGWMAQSHGYHKAVGIKTDLMVVPGAHHFSISYDMADPQKPLGHAMLAQMGLAS